MSTLRKSLSVAGVLAAALVLSACSGSPGPTSSSADQDFNDQDVTFVQSMLPHHEQAVEMSDMILTKGSIDPAVTDIAQQIKDAQAPEIETMNGWLEDWGVDGGDMGGMDHGSNGMMGDGMMSDEMMSDLDASAGDAASRMFLEQMTQHHDGAITMAQTEIDEGQSSDAIELAQAIVDTQEAEITQMKEILASL